MQSKKLLRMAIFAFLLLAMLPKFANAIVVTDPLCNGNLAGSAICTGTGFTPACSNGETPTCPNPNNIPVCSGTITLPTCSDGSTAKCALSHGLIDPAKVIFSGHSIAAQSILSVSLLIMLVMSVAVAIIYSIGYAFRLDKLLRFATSEIGEIMLTLLIVLVFVGAFTVTSTSIGAHNFFAAGSGALNDNVFISDCSLLVQESFNLLKQLFYVGFEGLLQQFAGSLQVSFEPNYFGISFRPLAGISALTPVINTMLMGTFGFITILMGVAAFMVIIYSLFPLFLYLGIILRTLPWTRPAGGAFLGMFIAFYIMFPLLIYCLLVSYIPYIGTPGLNIPINPVGQGASNPMTATCMTSQDNCQLQVTNIGTNGKTNTVAKVSGTGSASYDSKPLGSGCYNVIALDTVTKRSALQALTVGTVPTPCQAGYESIMGPLKSQSGSFDSTAFISLLSGQASGLNPYSSEASGPEGLLNGFVYNELEPVMYSLFSVGLSLVISFDFMEAMGDILGAPSLRSQNMLKRVL